MDRDHPRTVIASATGEERPLPCAGGGGVRFDVYDESTPYAYSNLWHVKLRLLARFPDAEVYERVLERMGVYEVDRDRVRNELVAAFEATALPYLRHPEFSRCVAERRRREAEKVRRLPGVP